MQTVKFAGLSIELIDMTPEEYITQLEDAFKEIVEYQNRIASGYIWPLWIKEPLIMFESDHDKSIVIDNLESRKISILQELARVDDAVEFCK